MDFNLKDYIMHHVANAKEWHLPFLPAIPLPEFLGLHGVMLILGAAFLLMLCVGLYRRREEVPRGITNLLEVFVIFIRDKIAIDSLGEEDGRRLTPLLCTFFFFILLLNLMGLVPAFASATANVSVTGALAIITFCFMVFGAIYKNGFGGFLKSLAPSVVPVPVLFILVPMELVGLFIKALALTIRLFANMLAGHIVILTLLGLVVLLGLVAMPAVLMAVFIALLEVMVAFLQAYIFTLLSAIFIGQTHHPAH